MSSIFRHFGIFILFLVLQVGVFNLLTLENTATPHVYLLFLLMLPLQIRFSVLITIAFFAGLAVDIFSVGGVKGLEAFSATLMMGLRGLWLMVISNRSYIRGNEEYFLTVQPLQWYPQYFFPLILIHHFAFYTLEAFGFQDFHITGAHILFSALYTFAFCFLFTVLFYKSVRR